MSSAPPKDAAGKHKQDFVIREIYKNIERIGQINPNDVYWPPIPVNPSGQSQYDFGTEYQWNDVKNRLPPDYAQLYIDLHKEMLDKTVLKRNFNELIRITCAVLEKPIPSINKMKDDVATFTSAEGIALPPYSLELIKAYTRSSEFASSLRASLRSESQNIRSPASYLVLELLKMTFEDFTVYVDSKTFGDDQTQQLKKKVTKTVWHGIGGVNDIICVDMFKQFTWPKEIKWKGPLSTSTKNTGTQNFNKGGFTLELTPIVKANSKIKYGIPVRVLSAFDYEEEVLFYNPVFKLKNIWFEGLVKPYPTDYLLKNRKQGCNKLWPNEELDWPPDVETHLVSVMGAVKVKGKKRELMLDGMEKCMQARFFGQTAGKQQCWQQMAPNSFAYFQHRAELKKVQNTNMYPYNFNLFNGNAVMFLGIMVLLMIIYGVSCLFGIVSGYVAATITDRNNKLNDNKQVKKQIEYGYNV